MIKQHDMFQRSDRCSTVRKGRTQTSLQARAKPVQEKLQESSAAERAKIEKAKKWLCLIKTEETLYHEVEKAIKKIHPYEIPEIIAITIAAGNREYFRALGQELRLRKSRSLR